MCWCLRRRDCRQYLTRYLVYLTNNNLQRQYGCLINFYYDHFANMTMDNSRLFKDELIADKYIKRGVKMLVLKVFSYF